MPPDESAYPADWARIARKDLSRVRKLLDVDHPDAAGFYLQQAMEKYLKAFLLSKKWKLKRTHDLDAQAGPIRPTFHVSRWSRITVSSCRYRSCAE